MRFTTLILITCFLSTSAFASDLQTQFAQSAREVPEALKAIRYHHFGNLDLQQFEDNFPSVKVTKANMHRVARRNGDGRITAHWQINGDAPVIAVNVDWWKHYREQQPVLALHEYLGALGYSDQEYWISTGLWFLSQSQTQSVLSTAQLSEVENFVASQSSIRLAGGVVGVGGGGETTTLYMKMHLLMTYVGHLKNAKTDDERDNAWAMIEHHLSSSLTVSYPAAIGK